MVYVEKITIIPPSEKRARRLTEFDVSIEPSNATNKTIKWKSSNPDVFIIGKDTGKAFSWEKGTFVITAEAQDGSGVKSSLSFTVEPSGFVESFTLNKSKLTLLLGESYDLVATASPSDASNKSVEWFSNCDAVATVDHVLGTVYAKGVGTTLIKAVAADCGGGLGTCTVTVVDSLPETEDSITDTETENPSAKPEEPAEDNGVTAVSESKFADPVDVFSGAHILENTIMQFFGGQKLALKLRYNSSQLASGVFGKGWYHNFEKHIVNIDDTEMHLYSTPSVYSRYKNNYSPEYYCQTPNRLKAFISITFSDKYPYTLFENDGSYEYYNTSGYLSEIESNDDFLITLSYSDELITITDTVTNNKIYLEKNSDGLVTRIYDDNSREAFITYTNGIITNIRDVNGNNLSFTYDDDGRVLTGTDGNGVCYFTNTYDDQGRVIEQKDAIEGSKKSIFEYDGLTRITTDRNGKKSTRVYNENGLLLSFTDAMGNTKSYSYDGYNNIIEETDIYGNSIIKEYNEYNEPIKITDKLGNVTTIEYSEHRVSKITYPEVDGVSAVESFEYGLVENSNDSYRKLLSHTDARGTVTTYTYSEETGLPIAKKVGDKNAIRYLYENGICSGYYDARGNLWRFNYNALGLLSEDIENNKAYEYDACGNLLKTTDGNGKTVVTTYDCNNQKSSVTDANGNRTEYVYNGNLKNTLVTLPDGSTLSYEYDGEDRPVKMTDAAGNVTAYEYDKVGRMICKTFCDGSTVECEYEYKKENQDALAKAENITKETDQKGAVTFKTYDGNGNLLTVTDNDGNVTQNFYDARNRLIKTVNPLGDATTYEYSPAGDLLCETDALGNKKSYTYDAYGNRLSATDQNGNTTTYTYDANDNLVKVTDALGNDTIYLYDCTNRLVAVRDARNNTVSYGYDLAGRRNKTTDANGNVFKTYYDGNGNVIKTTDALGNIISETVYNSLNLPIKMTDAMGNTTTYTYNSLGKVETVTNPQNLTREFTYTPLGMNTIVKDFAGINSYAEYDASGNVTKITGPLGAVTDFTYNNSGKLTAQSTLSGENITHTYNTLGLIETSTNARGQVKTNSYDKLGRVTQCTLADNTVSYTYDANGNVLTVGDNQGTITRKYDALNRVTCCCDANGRNIWYEYDEVGNITKITYYSVLNVFYTYDKNNRISTVTDWKNRVTSYTYDKNGNVIGIINPNGTTTTKVYDKAGRITSSVDRKSDGTIICGFEYTYDNLGQISTEKNLATNKTLCYTYDNLSRLIKRETKNAIGVTVKTECFSYDAAGNIVSAPAQVFCYDSNNRLTAIGGNAVNYDADGNMLHIPLEDGIYKTALSFDSQNRLTEAKNSTYTYDAENRRIGCQSDIGSVTYYYDTVSNPDRLLAIFDEEFITRLVYGQGLIGHEKGDSFYTYHYDYRGSVVAVTDSSEDIVMTAEYDAYGELSDYTGDLQIPFGFCGKHGVMTDTLGLQYMRSRYYSPVHKRFVSADILHGSIEDSTSLNRYTYVNGNPISYIDPLGLSAERGVESDSSFWDKLILFGSDFLRMGGDILESLHILITGLEFKGGFGTGLRGAISVLNDNISISAGGKVDLLTGKLNYKQIDLGQEALLGFGFGIANTLSIDGTTGYYESFITGEKIKYDPTNPDVTFKIADVDLYVIIGINAEISYNYIETYKRLADVWDDWNWEM